MKKYRLRRRFFWILIVLLSVLLFFAILLQGRLFSDYNPPGETLEDSSRVEPPTDEQLVRSILNNMTLEEKVGQMFFVRCRSYTAVSDIQTFSPGGYILFAPDIQDHSRETLKHRLESYQKNSRINMLIGVDEEGGSTVRVSKYPQFRDTPFSSPQFLYREGGYPLISDDTKEKSELLKSLGFNVNLAPVCDISTNSADYIHNRTIGKGPAETAEYVKTVVHAMGSSGLGCTLKHFPGYGGNKDTHKGLAVDKRSYDHFVSADFLPFRAGIEAGAGSVMICHNIVASMDETLPASLSPEVHKVLREELGFAGVIMTDDLQMDAIKKHIGDEASAVLAVAAGNDLIIASDFDIQIPSVIAAVKAGTISEKRIEESVFRILMWKLSLGILEIPS